MELQDDAVSNDRAATELQAEDDWGEEPSNLMWSTYSRKELLEGEFLNVDATVGKERIAPSSQKCKMDVDGKAAFLQVLAARYD